MSRSYSRDQHVFLGQRHAQAERNMWATIGLTVAMMAIEIVGGAWFGSVALVADGFHMTTHAGAPHSFEARLIVGGRQAIVDFAEPSHGLARDNSFRAELLHIVADAAVSALVIVGLTLAYAFGWLFLDPLAALLGALVIASWSCQLIRDTGRALLDINPDGKLGEGLRAAVEREDDAMTDLHLWRFGPGDLGAIVSIETSRAKDCAYYRGVLEGVARFSHLTVEVVAAKEPAAPRREVARAT